MQTEGRSFPAALRRFCARVRRFGTDRSTFIALMLLMATPTKLSADAGTPDADHQTGVFAARVRTSSSAAQTPPEVKSQTTPESFWLAVSRQALGTALGGLVSLFLLFILVHRYQRQNERQKLLHELSKEFAGISATPCVQGLASNGLEKEICYKFTVALTRHVPWNAPEKIKHDFATPDRLLLVSGEGGRISATVLHEALFWFRRIHRAKGTGLLQGEDLYQMWRQILPFVTDGRYGFLRRYWGQEDVKAILEVAGGVISYCSSKKLRIPLDYLLKSDSAESRVDREFLKDLPVKCRAILGNPMEACHRAAQPGVAPDDRPQTAGRG